MGYNVYCRECDWSIPEPVDLKGEANWLAGRHISQTGHSVALKENEESADGEADARTDAGAEDADFMRGPVEVIGPAGDGNEEHA